MKPFGFYLVVVIPLSTKIPNFSYQRRQRFWVYEPSGNGLPISQ
jgi:hypothetical protein